MSYSVFAKYYDALTENVEYAKRADYFLELMERLEHSPGLTLDLACGTGSLTLELFRRGLDIYGIDASVSMLSEARAKCAEQGADILFLCQKMQKLDLYGTIDTVLCSLDSLNHLAGKEQLRAAFSRISFFMNPGGYFVFDLNTVYKHQKILGNNTFVYDTDAVFCVWQNTFYPAAARVDIHLDFFERENAVYRRSSEEFSEWAYELPEVLSLLHEAGFASVEIYDELTFEPPQAESERLVFAARKAVQ